MVLQRWLGERTVHDVTLRGASRAPHQIDVLIGDERQRALIECKFFTDRVDLPIVRNFFAVVEDVGCDLAAIVTTVGFSANARTYAQAKAIDLLLLRDTVDEDLEGRVASIRLDITAFGAHLRTCRVVSPTDGPPTDHRVCIATNDPDCLIEYASGRRVTFGERYREHHDSFGFGDADGVYPRVDEFRELAWLVLGEERLALQRIEWEWIVSRSTTTSVTKHAPLVTLLGADGEVLEVVGEEQLRRLHIEPEGS